MTSPGADLLDREEAALLARALVVELTPHAGDREAVNGVLLDWLADLEVSEFARVCMTAMSVIFGECLTPPPPELNAPPGALALTPPLHGQESA